MGRLSHQSSRPSFIMSQVSFLLWSPRAPDHYPRTSSVQWRTTDDDDYEEYKISPIDDDGESHIYAKLARPGTHSYMMPRQHCSAAGAVMTIHCSPSAGMVLSQSLPVSTPVDH